MTHYLSLLITCFALLLLSPVSFGDVQHLQEHSEPTNQAPLPVESSPSDEEVLGTETETIEEDPTETIRYRTIKFVGKFHPIAVHFPIAFLLGAVFMQWVFVFTKKQQIPPIVTTMLWMGTLGAIGAATLGWAYAYDSMYFGDEDIELLKIHRWVGTGTAVAAVVTLLLKRFLKHPLILAILLSVLAALVGASAHYGGSLTYGADNFSDF